LQDTLNSLPSRPTHSHGDSCKVGQPEPRLTPPPPSTCVTPTPSGFLGAGAFKNPYAIAIDSAGNVWTTGNGSFLSELVGAAVPVAPLVQALEDGCLGLLPCDVGP
jgi:hypothetical protein